MTLTIHKTWAVLSGSAIMLLAVNSLSAGELQVPNQFNSGDATSAAQMNANFSAVETAVNDNDQRIGRLEANGPVVFQGFSDGIMDGTQGVINMTQACDATYQGSRMCTTTEFRDSPFNSNAGNLDTNAWINPVLIGVGAGTGASGPAYGAMEVVSGVIVDDPKLTTCNSWRSTSEGTVLTPVGQVMVKNGSVGCSNEYRVACCK